jgi:hypothetical protein
MSDNVQTKRSYTAPIIFIVLVVLLTLIIVVYTKYLTTKQVHTTDQGKQLAEQYVYAQVYADRLRDGAEGLLNAKTEAERLRAVRLLGEADLASSETVGLFVEAAHLTSGQSREEAAKPLFAAMTAVMGEESALTAVGEHEGELTGEEIAMLTLVRDSAAQMQQALDKFRAPSGEAGFRQMVTVAEWVPNAVEASKSLEQLAKQF